MKFFIYSIIVLLVSCNATKSVVEQKQDEWSYYIRLDINLRE